MSLMRRLRKVENYVDEPKTPGYHHESFQLVLYVYKTKSPAGKELQLGQLFMERWAHGWNKSFLRGKVPIAAQKLSSPLSRC